MKTSFYFMLFKAFHAQRNHLRQDMNNKYGLSPGQPKVLRYISMHKNCMLKDIATNCDVEPATVSKILNNLEEEGMLKRQVVKDNKRALQLSITKQGQEALDKWNLHCAKVEALSLYGFSEAESALFRNYLSRMYANLTGKDIE